MSRTRTRRSGLARTIQAGAAIASVYALRAALLKLEAREANAGLGSGKTFLILGTGFAGSAVAQELARLLPQRDNGKILLLGSENYTLFTPMLTEAAGGELNTRHIVSPIRSARGRIDFVQAKVTSINLQQKSAQVQMGAADLDLPTRTFTGDHLVLALGSVVNFHGIPGVAEHSIPMKKLDDASAVFERVSACLVSAAVEEDAARRKELLTFVVGGGGYTGVETMAAINDFVRASARNLPAIQSHEIRTLLIHPGDRLLPELTPDLASFATEKLKQRQVEILLNTRIDGAGDGYVQVQGGENVRTKTFIWAAGVTPNPLIDNLPAPKGKHHGLAVDPSCQLPGYPGIWALGDCAEIPMPDGHGTYAPTAQNATREGTLVARNIVRTLQGKAPQAFSYTPVGELALVGRHSGVARVYGHNFAGPLAWAMWRAVYLAKMPSLAQRGRILSDWLLDLLFGREPVPISTGRDSA